MSHDQRNDSFPSSLRARSASLRSRTRYCSSLVSPRSSLPASSGSESKFSLISGPAVWMPGEKWRTSRRLRARSSMKRTFSGRSWASSMIPATRGPFGVQPIRANTNSSRRPDSSSTARAASSSLLEQMAFTMPRRLSERISSAREGSRATSPSLRVPDQRVSSRSQTISLTAPVTPSPVAYSEVAARCGVGAPPWPTAMSHYDTRVPVPSRAPGRKNPRSNVPLSIGSYALVAAVLPWSASDGRGPRASLNGIAVVLGELSDSSPQACPSQVRATARAPARGTGQRSR